MRLVLYGTMGWAGLIKIGILVSLRCFATSVPWEESYNKKDIYACLINNGWIEPCAESHRTVQSEEPPVSKSNKSYIKNKDQQWAWLNPVQVALCGSSSKSSISKNLRFIKMKKPLEFQGLTEPCAGCPVRRNWKSHWNKKEIYIIWKKWQNLERDLGHSEYSGPNNRF